MTPTAPVQPHHIWVARHKVGTTLLVLLVVALACGAILGNIHGSLTTAAGITALVALAVTVASLVWLHLQPTGLSPVRNPVQPVRHHQLPRGLPWGHHRVRGRGPRAGRRDRPGPGRARAGRGHPARRLCHRPGGDQLVPDGPSRRKVDPHRVDALRAGLRRLRRRAGRCRGSRGCPVQPRHMARAGSRLPKLWATR